MRMPDLSETIVAVSSAWQPSRVGILRVSGPDAFAIVARAIGLDVICTTGRFPAMHDVRLPLDECGTFAASLVIFRGPRSYTGQDVVELHLPGNLPLLREFAGRLIAAGARRALPGEFSARAFLLGKLDRAQAEGVLGLVHAESEAAARQSARLTGGEASRLSDEVGHRLLDLLARIEAGIDFVDEEDVRFITAADAAVEIDAIADVLRRATVSSEAAARRQRPHVAIAGLPNAGKSTLFNALLGADRAIVSPVIGTTRDVLSAETEFDGVPIVLQDTAGLGHFAGPLDLAAHIAAEASADEADVVLWAHDSARCWEDAEVDALRRLRGGDRICLLTKADLANTAIGSSESPPVTVFTAVIRVCTVRRVGLAEIRRTIANRLRQRTVGGHETYLERERVLEHLMLARRLLADQSDAMLQPEVVAMELRTAWEGLEPSRKHEITEETLGRIFTRFCIGK